jgi:hypothetical protein
LVKVTGCVGAASFSSVLNLISDGFGGDPGKISLARIYRM